MTRHPRRLVPALVLVAALTAACGSRTDEQTLAATYGLPDVEQSLRAHEWLLDASDSSLPPERLGAVTLAIGPDGALSGVAPCNAYRGSWTLDDHTLEVAGVAGTRRACEPEVDAAEDAFLDALVGAHTVDVTDRDRLVLTDGDQRLAFRALDVPDELAGEWQVVTVAAGDALTSVLDGTSPTLTFTDDRALVVATGCNTLRTDWEVEGREITLGPVAGTTMACPEPEGAEDQERSLATALEAATHVAVTPDTLTLTDADGTILVVARRD